jgi:hypothetical protein
MNISNLEDNFEDDFEDSIYNPEATDPIDNVFRTADIVQGYEVINEMRQESLLYKKAIKECTNRQKTLVKNIKEMYVTISEIKTRISEKNLDGDNYEKLNAAILDMMSYEYDFKKMIRESQDLEKRKLDYYKLIQAEQKNMVAAIKVQGEALKEENWLIAIHQVLLDFDKKKGTTFHVGFLDDVKERMMNRMRGQDIAVQTSTMFKPINPLRKKHSKEEVVKKAIKKYNIPKDIAEQAYEMWIRSDAGRDEHAKRNMAVCVEKAKNLFIKKQYKIGIENKKTKESGNETDLETEVA